MKRWIHAATNTRDRISYLEEKIEILEEQLRRNDYLDPEELIDDQIELEELKEQLNFAWQDDEAEYNYALQQQEFNPDGSLKGYDDIYESTQVKASSKYAVGRDNIKSSTSIKASRFIDNDKIQVGLVWNRDWHQFTVESISPDHKTCKVSEEWIAEDSGKEIRKVYTYRIEADEKGQEYCYNPDYEEYKDEWWGKMYAQGADNYEFDWKKRGLDDPNDDSDDEYEYDEDDYTPSATHGDYSPSNPWDAPGMSIRDFI